MTARPRGSQAMYWPKVLAEKSTWDDSAATCLAKCLLMGFHKPVLMSIKLKNDQPARIRANDHPISIHLKFYNKHITP